MTVYDKKAEELINKAAEALKKIEHIKAPEWAKYVKTGVHKERPPIEKDWWYARTASLLRKIYLFGPIGVNKLRKKYGGKKNRGHKPERSYPGSGNIIRKILQQLEKAELVKYAEKKVHKGRIITPKGKKFLDKIATEMVGLKPRKEVKPKVEKKVKKTEKPTEAKNEIKVEKEEQK